MPKKMPPKKQEEKDEKPKKVNLMKFPASKRVHTRNVRSD